MGERKVLNHWYPPDFDPRDLPKPKKAKIGNQKSVRMAIPVRCVRCTTCGHYMFGGTRFNARKEKVEDESYLGIDVIRLYFKCNNCKAEITLKTDPQTSDYVCEHGATRGFEPWLEKKQNAGDDPLKMIYDEENTQEENDPMKNLESRVEKSKKEMDILDALSEIKDLKKAQSQLTTEELLDTLEQKVNEQKKQEEEEDELLLSQIDFTTIKRLPDEHPPKTFVNKPSNISTQKEQPKKKTQFNKKAYANNN